MFMENLNCSQRKNIHIAPLANLNKSTIAHSPQDKLNSLSLDLEKLRKKDRIFPEISTSRKALLNGINDKLKRIKEKLKESIAIQQSNIQQNASYQQPTIIPIPINYSMPYQVPYYPFQCGYPLPCQQCQNCCKENKKKPRKNKKQKKPKKEVKVKKKNLFRICGYAIYFIIFLKHYSQKFTINRRNWSTDRYNSNVKGIIDRGSQKFQQKLLELDLYEISSQAKSMKKEGVNWQDITNTALIPQGVDPEKASRNRYTMGQFLINFTENFMEKLKQIIFDEQFLAEYHEVLSAGSMDMNFLIDNLYLPEEVPFLFIHPTKGYLRLGCQEQIQLLLMKLMIRMVIFNFLLPLPRFKDWNKKLQDKYRFQLAQRQQIWQLARVLGVFLYMATRQLYMQGIKNIRHVSNFYELRKKFGIHQAKTLQQQKGLSEGDQHQFHLIKNIKDYQLIVSKLSKNGKIMEYKQVLKDKLLEYLSSLHKILKREQRQLYLYIQNMTINTPFIIFDGIKKNKQDKQNKYRVLKPLNNQKLSQQWHKIYGNQNSSFSGVQNKNRKNVKFEDSSFKDLNTQLGSRNTERQNLTLENLLYENLKLKNMNNTQNIKSSPMKKPFNFDTVNSKYDKNRQDRLQQKFRNFLFTNQPKV